MSAIKEKLFAGVSKLELYVIAEEWAKELQVKSEIVREALVEFVSKKRLGQTDDAPAMFRASFDAYVTKDEIKDFCDALGWTLPRFWFPPERKKPLRSYAKAEEDCYGWLSSMVSEGEKPLSKKKLYELAKDQFPGLSEKAFNRAREQAFPLEWKMAGRPQKQS